GTTVQGPGEPTAAERDAQAAAEAVARITADLEKARQAAGIKAPIDELIFLPSLPVRVEQNGAALGDPASGHVGVVTNNQLAIDSSLQLDEAPLVQPGMPVTIDEPDLGISATGVAGRVADTPGTDGVDGFHIYLEVLVDGASPSLGGTSLRLTISIESTGGKVTAVPVSALSLAADGSSRIQVDNNGTLTYVTVKSGLSAGGYVEVAPVNDTLQPGQLVVIGFDGNGS
ncbi:MAG: peptidoglycan-binding protein, partial [Anaerolineae bacterium]